MLRDRMLTVEEVKEITVNYSTARTTLSRLVRKGYVLRARKGIYVAVPPEQVGGRHEVDRYILASKVTGNGGVLAYHTALELHGVAQSYFNTVYCFTRRSPFCFDFQDLEYKLLRPGKLFGVARVTHEGVELNATDRERTILDCIRRPDYCGGIEELLKSIGAFHTVDVSILGKYLKQFGELSLIQRSGFVLSLFKEGLRVPDGFLDQLKHRVGRKAYYLVPSTASGSGRLVKEWNVIVPRNIEEVARFA